MPDGLEERPVNQVIYGSKENTGINRTGILFGNPVSSYDVNSTQNNLINLLASYMNKTNASTASVDLEGWGASTVANRNSKLHNIRAAIADSDTGETYFLYCPELDINLPSGTNADKDQYLRIYYKIMTYTQGDPQSSHYPDMPKSNNIYKYGYKKSSCTVTPEVLVENDIGNNQIDSEVSVRRGIQWTLVWDNKENDYITEYKKGPIVALYRYKSSSAKFLFNTTRQLAYNSNILSVPTIYTKTIGNYIILDGIYDMLMSNQDSSVFKAMVVFDQSFKLNATKHIVIGVKDAPDIELEYRLVDGLVVDPNSTKWYIPGWIANKPYLMHCAEGIMSYTDPSVEQWHYLPCYTIGRSNSGQIGTVINNGDNPQINATELVVIYIYDSSSSRWHPKARMSYTLGIDPGTGVGIEHVYSNGEWKTVIPAGTLVSMPVTYKDGSANTNGRLMIPGTVLCNGASLNKTQYSELFKVLGTRFGGDSTTFKVPNYSGLYPKSLIGNITSPYTNTTDSKVTLTASNIPTMQVRNTSGSDTSKISITVDTKAISAPAYTTKVWFKTLPTISLSKTVLDNLMKSMLKHYHIPGNLAYHADTLDSNAFMYNQTNTVSDSTVGSHRIKFPSAIDPGSNATTYVDSNKKVTYTGIRTTGPINTGVGNQGEAALPAAVGKKGPNISWGLTSLGIQSKSIASDIDADLEVTAGESGSSKYFDARTSTTTNLNHSHTGSLALSSLKVGTTGSSATPITIEPSYYKVNTYIYLGQSLVVPETSTTVTIENQGTAYAAPSISPEMYTIETIEE